jgi:hypothetical protein
MAEPPDTAVINILQCALEEIIRASFRLRKMAERKMSRRTRAHARVLSYR